MRKLSNTLLSAALAIILFATMIAVSADTTTYNSSDDPLISKSYIDEVLMPEIKELIGEEDEKNDETALPEGTLASGDTYAVISLAKGQTLFASGNSCEVILRSGAAKVVSPFVTKYEEQGIADFTDGKDLYNDAEIISNHLLLIPRDDGRGIAIESESAWLMVRGYYKILTPEPAAETTAETETTAE